MATEIYIGSERLDCSDQVSAVFSGGDIRELNSGRVSSSYNISLPLTARNKRLLGYNNEINSFSEVTAIGSIFVGGVMILKGKVIVLTNDSLTEIEIMIQGTGWIDHFKDKRLRDLDLSAYDHEYNYLNISLSWNTGTKHYRYPLINFGRLFSQMTGYTASWCANDFIPAFRVSSILERIFAPWTISGAILTDLNDRYVLGAEQVAESDFIVNKNFEVRARYDSDNDASATIPALNPTTVTFAEAQLVLLTEITDEGNDFMSSQYTVPETGTYYFGADFKPYWNKPSYFTIDSQSIYMKIVRSRSGVETTLESQLVNYTSTDILNMTYNLNSGWVHCEAGDLIYLKGLMTNRVTNTDSVDHICTICFENALTKIWSDIDERCRYTGIGKTIVCKDWMPDVMQIDFVKAIKEAYNLKFTPDLMRQAVVIESADVARSQTVRPLTEIDMSGISQENIAQNYKNNITLRFIDDTADKAVSQIINSTGRQFSKSFSLTSEYAERGEEEYVNSLFAWTASGFIEQNNVFTPLVLRIFGNQNFDIYNYPLWRPTGFTPRLLKWEGLTSGFTWYVNGSSRTTYPKAVSEDMALLYSSYFQRTFHLIDRGKVVKFTMKNDPKLLQEFITVISNVSDEGFNPIYSFTVGNNTYHGYLNKIEFSGDTALLELLIKH